MLDIKESVSVANGLYNQYGGQPLVKILRRLSVVAWCAAKLDIYLHAEPLLSSDFPWQRVASDLFEWKKSKYLLVIDYFSRFIEIGRLSTATSNDVITHMKSIFARHGVPESLTSDNGPQYTANMYKTFTNQYGFTYLTSSPRYPQGNDAAERAVRTVKNFLEKSADPYVALSHTVQHHLRTDIALLSYLWGGN